MQVLVILLVSLAAAGLAEDFPQGPGIPRIGDFIQKFAQGLSSASLAETRNAVFSPFSITSLLSMLLMGSSGSTYDQLRAALRYPPKLADNLVHETYRNLMQTLLQENPGIIVSVANRIFLNPNVDILKEYSDNALRFYMSGLEQVDFSHPGTARDAINAWVNQNTRGKIPKLLTHVDPQTSALAVNTVYFKGDWNNPFDKQSTTRGNFNTGTRIISIPMMSTVMRVLYTDLPALNADMIGLTYKGGQFAMYFIVPKGSASLASLHTLESQLDPHIINRYIRNISEIHMNVFLPRMRLNFKTDLADTLKQFGVTDLFDASRADFSKMSSNRIFVDKVIHETVIDITEAGTEAAAATAATIVRFGSSREFAVNRPFLLLLREQQTGVPLFWGRVVEPEPLN
ncbi:leukocyte elastase inhibitor A-like [Penaeus chinensis]|uniref:leukocyte elastase inhibitor A-like n=1 Tax=Penaeus chinensis TaxID=139456 RepID=UPI001FB81D7B|nr:leukocyte elastase inhibitor A-like [Penaeus chinensis]